MKRIGKSKGIGWQEGVGSGAVGKDRKKTQSSLPINFTKHINGLNNRKSHGRSQITTHMEVLNIGKPIQIAANFFFLIHYDKFQNLHFNFESK